MPPVSLDLPLITAAAALPEALDDAALLEAEALVREALADQLVPERVGDQLVVTALPVTAGQAQALAKYVRHLAGEQRRFLDREAREFLDAFFGS